MVFGIHRKTSLLSKDKIWTWGKNISTPYTSSIFPRKISPNSWTFNPKETPKVRKQSIIHTAQNSWLVITPTPQKQGLTQGLIFREAPMVSTRAIHPWKETSEKKKKRTPRWPVCPNAVHCLGVAYSESEVVLPGRIFFNCQPLTPRGGDVEPRPLGA